MNRKKIISAVLLATVMFSNIGSAQTVLAKDSNLKHSNISTTMNSPSKGDIIDFKEEDKEEAKEWGKEKEKEWKLTSSEKQNISKYIKDKDSIKTDYNKITYSMAGEFDSEKEILKDIDKSLEKANLSDTVVTYKNVDANSIGFNGELFSGNDINKDELKKFEEQFLHDKEKDNYLKLDSYFETNINEQKLDHDKRIILKVTVPSSKGRTHPTKAGVILDGEEYKMLVSNDYVIKVDSVHQSTLKGRDYVIVNGELQESLDFKNDLNGLADRWGKKNYKEWADDLSVEEREALDGYIRREYKDINAYLRNDSKPVSGSTMEESRIQDRIEKITESLEKRPIPENVTVYRWCGAAEFGYEIGKIPEFKKFEEDFLNKDKLEKGYMSTSLSSEALSAFSSRKIILRLQLPQGSKGAYVSALGGFGSEKEMLLDKGSKYHINKISKAIIKGKEKYIVDATLLKK
ncbi:ADP-ribosyltransferase [Clostridium botulinum]|uniref:ADP-ribosyltransferase n=1 Tax=Clostridium botulinum TaxID=1491 RepID=UPI001E40C38F|nr:ADP-ribosyltransferase [Clostridium botulinum]MCC5425078.1 ADP-ribosyltransferase [Clostridium botulinum]